MYESAFVGSNIFLTVFNRVAGAARTQNESPIAGRMRKNIVNFIIELRFCETVLVGEDQGRMDPWSISTPLRPQIHKF